jgi:hypothetical protein
VNTSTKDMSSREKRKNWLMNILAVIAEFFGDIIEALGDIDWGND